MSITRLGVSTAILLLLGILLVTTWYSRAQTPEWAPLPVLNALFHPKEIQRSNALDIMDARWRDGYAAVLLDIILISPDRDYVARALDILERHTGQPAEQPLDDWLRWLWDRQPELHPQFAEFRSALYAQIDPAFAGYFSSDRKITIRLDEIRWGGVFQDGIPPLHKPEMLAASEASYLEDDHVVFGLEINGDARAYPNRILSHHEMATDVIGGEEITLVYCTLCGTVIPFKSTLNGKTYRLGTSGFLYLSNKLMYDKGTQSLWNTIWGTPVVGPLVGQGIQLERLSVVTTTWGEWRRRHPDTQVLDINTGYFRNYAEGAGYREYFATDELMFPVPRQDSRLLNKAQVLTLLPDDSQTAPLAIDTDWLKKNPVHHLEYDGQQLVFVTDSSGAARVYASGKERITEWLDEDHVQDSQGNHWTLTEAALTAPAKTTGGERTMPRVPAHRAFWFGWYAAYPNTRLIR